jgi:hypothetical protein
VGAFLCVVLPVGLKWARLPAALSIIMDGDRYFFLPHALLGWLLMLAFASQKSWTRWIPVVLAAIALGFNARYLHQRPLTDYAWKSHVQPIREGRAISIPINPDGFILRSNGRRQAGEEK